MRRLTCILLSIGLGAALFVPAAQGQTLTAPKRNGDPGAALQGLGSLGAGIDGNLGLGGGLPGGDEHVQLEAAFRLFQGETEGVVSLRAKMEPEWHVYSYTQPKGGPTPSTIVLLDNPWVSLAGDFKADSDPEVHPPDDIWPVKTETHSGTVTWTAPIVWKAASGTRPEDVAVTLQYSGQVCRDEQGCVPLEKLDCEAKFTGHVRRPRPTGEFRPALSKVTWTGHAEPRAVAPGGKLRIHLTATPDEKNHIYEVLPSDPQSGNKPTLFGINKRNGWPGKLRTSAKPVAKAGELGSFDAPVTFTVELDVPRDAALGESTIGGLIGYQTCTDTGCMPPDAIHFQVGVTVAKESEEGQTPLLIEASAYDLAAQAAASHPLTVSLGWSKLIGLLGFGLLGGLILNLMPCVLPVIGLKILSFVEQSGQSRWNAFMLNYWFSAGLISVFILLATLATFLNLGWGEQFTFTWFKVLMTGVVFAMALSFLGVWELPIPGFAGSSASQTLQEKEGPAGAFFKGVFTTILATPCSGPFLGALFAYTLSQPPSVIYMIYGSIGLGMASPYMLAGIFPALVSWLPKPGAWMETFKHIMGFVLLGTVVFQFSTINPDFFIATLTLMFAIWFACWLVGRVPFTADVSRKATAWIGGVAVASAIGWGAFTYLTPHQKYLQWTPYSEDALAKAQAEGKTVLVDYTAAWCLTCKLNLRWAVDTRRVKSLVDEYDVVPMLADWTDNNSMIKQSLSELNSNSIPLLVVYPAGKPEQPIVLRDLLKERQVLEALETAGPSKTSLAQRPAEGQPPGM